MLDSAWAQRNAWTHICSTGIDVAFAGAGRRFWQVNYSNSLAGVLQRGGCAFMTACPHCNCLTTCDICFQYTCVPCLTAILLTQAEEFGRKLAHQFPWSPAAGVAVGLALRRRYQSHSGNPSTAANRKQIIKVRQHLLPPSRSRRL